MNVCVMPNCSNPSVTAEFGDDRPRDMYGDLVPETRCADHTLDRLRAMIAETTLIESQLSALVARRDGGDQLTLEVPR